MEYLDENALRVIMMKIENEDDLKSWCETNCKIRKMCKKYKKEWYTPHTQIVEDADEYGDKRKTKIIGNRKYVTVWRENGNKWHKKEYKNGKLEGKYIEWYENGKKWYEQKYKDGKEEGKYIEWYENGKKMTEEEYKDGELEGKLTMWYESGTIRYEEKYKNGKREGKWLGWHEDGNKEKEGEWKNGKKCGIWKEWNKNGKLISWENYGSCSEVLSISPRKKSKKAISQKKCAAQGKMQNTIIGGCRRKCKIGKEKIGSDGKCTKR